MKYKLPPELQHLTRVHASNECLGEFCCLHKPSDHPLNTAPYNWREDNGLMERICDHGIGHPDPDDLSFKRLKAEEINNALVRTTALGNINALGIHSCDGCCAKSKTSER